MIDDATRTERLRQLRRVIDSAPEERFVMRTWSERSGCQTTFCAAGWCAVDSWFRENTKIGTIFAVAGDSEGQVTVYPINYVFNVFRDLANLFSISIDDAEALFGVGIRSVDPHAVSRAEVLANIDRLLAGKPAEVYAAARNDDADKYMEDDLDDDDDES
jgi:hypothetical protein